MKIQILTNEDLVKIKKLYKKAFPIIERKPFFLINKIAKQGKSETVAFYENGKFVGFAINLVSDRLILVDYFAVEQSKRGMGYGSKALELLKEKYKNKTIMLEVEEHSKTAKNSSQRESRFKFYYSNGFVDSHFKIHFLRAKLEVLSYPDKISFDEYLDFQNKVMGKSFVKIGRIYEIK